MRLITSGVFRGLPRNHYQTLYVDPPWRYKTFTADPGDRAPPYPTMPMDEIKALPMVDLCRRDTWLQCWTSGPYLNETLDCIRDWGFRYSSISFTWVKLRRVGEGFHKGLGKTTRKNTELVILAKIGSPRIITRPDELLVTEDPDHEVFIGRLREHSRKPDEIRDRVAAMCGGPRLELFARQRHPDFHSWGNQCDKWGPILEPGTDERVPSVQGSES